MGTPNLGKSAVGIIALLLAIGLAATSGASADVADECFVDTELDVGLVMDRSGSMGSDNRMETAKKGAQNLVENLTSNDQSGLVSYSSSATLDKAMDHDHAATSNAIDGLFASGQTAIGKGIALSHQDFLDNGRQGVRSTMVLLTDGLENQGSEPVKKAQAAKDDGIEIFAIGVGSNINEPQLRQIASEPEDVYFHHAENTDEIEDVFKWVTKGLQTNDTQAPNVSIDLPQAGHMYIDGTDQGPGTSLVPASATLVGDMPFEVTASDNCYLEYVELTVPGTGFTHKENATAITTSPFPASSIAPGDYTLDVEAVDWIGLQAFDEVGLHVPDMGSESRVVGLWAGAPTPENPEYRTQGVHLVEPGEALRRTAEVDEPGLVWAESFRESGSTTVDGAQRAATGEVRVSQLQLFDGLVVAENLVHRANGSVDLTTGTADLSEEVRRIGSLEVAGERVDLDDGATGPLEIDLPGNGFLRLFERNLTTTPVSLTYESTLLHAYAPDAYGGGEVIIGDVFLEPGGGGEPTPQPREIVHQDDAGSGRDAGPPGGGPVALTDGLYEGTFVPGDNLDTYTLEAVHGEKIKLNLEPSKRARVIGGGLAVNDTDAQPKGPTVEAHLPPMRIDLYDPDGQLRAHTIFTSSPAAQSVELNADKNGTWTVDIQRTDGFDEQGEIDDRYSYYSFDLTVTDHPLLPQTDALSGADAPPSCEEETASIPTIDDGQWPGVLRDDDFNDVYRFHADIGDLITATLKPGETTDGVDMDFYLYDEDCQVLDDSSIAGPYTLKGVPEAVLDLPADYTGTYYLRVERVNGVGNHHVTLSVRDPMPGLPTNDAHTGEDADSNTSNTTQAPPAAFQGTLHDGDDGDAYALSMTAGDNSHIVFEMSALSRVNVRLFDPGGNQVSPWASLEEGTFVWDFVAQASGDYVLLVEPTGVGGGDYTVAWGQRPVIPMPAAAPQGLALSPVPTLS